MPFLVLSIRCTFLRQTLGATPGGERLKRELTVNSSLSQGQKETLPVFSFCSTNVEQIGVFIVSDSTSYQFSPHSSKVVVFFSRWYLEAGFSPTTQLIRLTWCSETGPFV